MTKSTKPKGKTNPQSSKKQETEQIQDPTTSVDTSFEPGSTHDNSDIQMETNSAEALVEEYLQSDVDHKTDEASHHAQCSEAVDNQLGIGDLASDDTIPYPLNESNGDNGTQSV